MRPRIALSAVVLPAPLGPMSPRMRPSSTRKSTPSNAIVVPKALRSPRASMHAMASAFLLFCFRLRSPACAVQQFFRFQSEPLNVFVNPGPFFGEKFLAFALQQQTLCTGIDKHPEASPALNQPLVHQLLIAFQNCKWIDPILGRDIAHGRQGITLLENAVKDHRNHAVAKLAVNRLTVTPLTVHRVSNSLLRKFPSVTLHVADRSERG